MCAQDALVGLHQALRVPLGGEVPLRVRSRGRPQARAELGVGEEPLEGRGQDGGRARRDEEPRAPGEEDASARGRSGRDDRTTRGGGVEAQAAHEPPGLRLVVAREVERLDDAAERRREERRPADVAADDQEPGGEAAAAEEGGRLDEVAVPLGRVEEAEEAGDRDAGGDAERAPLRRGRSRAEALEVDRVRDHGRVRPVGGGDVLVDRDRDAREPRDRGPHQRRAARARARRQRRAQVPDDRESRAPEPDRGRDERRVVQVGEREATLLEDGAEAAEVGGEPRELQPEERPAAAPVGARPDVGEGGDRARVDGRAGAPEELRRRAGRAEHVRLEARPVEQRDERREARQRSPELPAVVDVEDPNRRAPADQGPDRTASRGRVPSAPALASACVTAMRPWLLPARVPRSIWLVGGAGVALACALAAPSTALLPAPASGPAKLGAAAALFLAFALGFLRPRPALYLLVVLAVGEGAVRKWLVNDIDVFLLKDVLLLGIYAGVLPRLRRDALRRPWWLLAPLAGVIALALVESARSPSLSEAVVGLRSYTIDVPLLWVGPVLLEPARRALVLLVLTLALGVGEAVLAVAQALSQSPVLNKQISGALPAEITVRGVTYLRASGTFMQSGTLAAFLAFAVLVSFTFVAVFRRGWRYVLGVAAPALLTWGLVYGAARSLFGTTLVALAVLLGVLAVQRRLASFLLVPASLGVGFVLLFTLVPAVEDGVHAVGRWWRVGPP